MSVFRVFLVSLCLGFCLVARPAFCETDNPPPFEIQINFSAGGAPWMKGYHSVMGESTTALATGHVAARYRFPKYTPLFLEVSIVFPHGVGGGVGVDLVHVQNFRSFLLVGALKNLTVPVSVAQVERKSDLTVGLGVELRLTKKLSMTADWRAFLPSPVSTVMYYGNFALPLYEEAFKGGQVWIGFSKIW